MVSLKYLSMKIVIDRHLRSLVKVARPDKLITAFTFVVRLEVALSKFRQH